MATIKSKDIEVEASTKGAELKSIRSGGVEYLWQGDPAFWPRRSPLLFPIVGGLPGGTYSYAGKSYSMGNHGFVRDLEFRLESSRSREVPALRAFERRGKPRDLPLQVQARGRHTGSRETPSR